MKATSTRLQTGPASSVDKDEAHTNLHAAVCAGYYTITDELLIIEPHAPKNEACHRRIATKKFIKTLGSLRADAVQLYANRTRSKTTIFIRVCKAHPSGTLELLSKIQDT